MRAATPLFLPENLERSQRLIEVLREVAAAHRVTPAQIALAWVIHPPAVAAIPGAASVRQLEDNVAAAGDRSLADEYKAPQLRGGGRVPARRAADGPHCPKSRWARFSQG